MELADWIAAGAVCVLGSALAWILTPVRSFEAELRAQEERERAGAVPPTARPGNVRRNRRSELNGPGYRDLRRYGPRRPRQRTTPVHHDEDIRVDGAVLHMGNDAVPWDEVVRFSHIERGGRGQVRVHTRKRCYAFYEDALAEGSAALRAAALEMAAQSAAVKVAQGWVAASPSLVMREPDGAEVWRRADAWTLPVKELNRFANTAFEEGLPRPHARWGARFAHIERSASVRPGALTINGAIYTVAEVWRIVEFDSDLGRVVWIFAPKVARVFVSPDSAEEALANFKRRAKLVEIPEESDIGWRPRLARAWERPVEEARSHKERRWRERVNRFDQDLRPFWSPFRPYAWDGRAESEFEDSEEFRRWKAELDQGRSAEAEPQEDSGEAVVGAFAGVLVAFVKLVMPLSKGIGSALKAGATTLKSTKGAPTVVSMGLAIWSFAAWHGLAGAVGVALLILVHELGHGLAMRAKGLRPGPIVFVPFFGAVIGMKDEPPSAASDAAISLAGPVVGGLAALACWPVYRLTGSEYALGLFFAGCALNLLNLIPALPFDGGHVASTIHPVVLLVGVSLLAFALRESPSYDLIDVVLLLGVVLSLERTWSRYRNGPRAVDRIPGGHRSAIAAAYFLTMGALAAGLSMALLGEPRDIVARWMGE